MASHPRSSPPADHIEAFIEGQVSGQVAVGKHILMVGPVYGGVVNIAPPGQSAAERIYPRSRPVRLLPRAPASFVDRETEVKTLSSHLTKGDIINIYGQEGIGKTTLLRYLSHRPIQGPFSDGIVYLSARYLSLDDFLHNLLMAFYESSVPVKLTRAEVRAFLAELKALVLIDDVNWAREDIEILLDAAPQITFVFVSTQRHLYGGVARVPLRGLPVDAAVELFEAEVRRPLSTEEQATAQRLMEALGGHPLAILQLASEIADGGLSVEEALARVQRDRKAPERAAVGVAYAGLNIPQQRLLAALSALGSVPLPAEVVAEAAGMSDVDAVTSSLQKCHMAISHGSQHSAFSLLVAVLERSPQMEVWRERVVNAYLQWAKLRQSSHDVLAQNVDSLLSVLKWLSEKERWADVLSLVQWFDVPLALSGRWQVWLEALECALQAAQQSTNLQAEAWVLHQLGTRALCLNELGQAKALLSQALTLREQLGDAPGAAITRHNLSLVSPPMPPSKSADSSVEPTPAGGPGLVKLLFGAVFLAVAGLAAYWFGGTSSSKPASPAVVFVEPTVTPTPTPVQTPSQLVHAMSTTQTLTPSPTFTPTNTPPVSPMYTATPTLTPRPTWTSTWTPAVTPEISLTAQGECGWKWEPGAQSVFDVLANFDGWARVYLRNEVVWEAPVRADLPHGFMYGFSKPGEYVFTAVLLDKSRENKLAWSECVITIVSPLPTYTPTATRTTTPPFSPTPSLTPSPTGTPTFTPTPTLPVEITLPGIILEPLPDIVVREVYLGDIRETGPDSWDIEVIIWLVNQGEALAVPFKVSLDYSVEPKGDRRWLYYQVIGQEEQTYPFVFDPLPPGEFIELVGIASVRTKAPVIYLWVIADSCAGDEFMPDECRVKEADEENNLYGPVEVRLW